MLLAASKGIVRILASPETESKPSSLEENDTAVQKTMCPCWSLFSGRSVCASKIAMSPGKVPYVWRFITIWIALASFSTHRANPQSSDNAISHPTLHRVHYKKWQACFPSITCLPTFSSPSWHRCLLGVPKETRTSPWLGKVTWLCIQGPRITVWSSCA